ncbi:MULTISPECIES: PadR family transcriptional regulator [unclassified Pseudonocardia]|uniref:PadR family transcriptional regulator n=1 Tax=Pseudonocardia sp. EC080619-01 TaxID=1096856 RepID=UPI001D0534D9|nr:MULTISPECIES: PadR family transcriptional regulator [unclassified Pseudonocardia]
MYRALRGMEKRGFVRSEWHASAVGPARRTYHLTAAGQAHLDGQVRNLEEAHAALQEFLDRYAAVNGIAHEGVTHACSEPPRRRPVASTLRPHSRDIE